MFILTSFTCPGGVHHFLEHRGELLAGTAPGAQKPISTGRFFDSLNHILHERLRCPMRSTQAAARCSARLWSRGPRLAEIL